LTSCNPFEDINDTLFHDFGREEVLEEPLDATNIFERRQTKHFVLRIKPLAMKRRWRGMYIKRKKNSGKEKHVETLLSFLLLDEGEVVQTCRPPAHEDEEKISLDDAYDLVYNLSDMVDLHIDDFIQVGRRRWDFGRFIFYRDPIYDIEGISQAKGFELSSSKDWSSTMYDSDVW
jgi:hypothetical protein